MKIVILDSYTIRQEDLSWDGLSAYGELTVYDRTDDCDILSRIGDAEIVITSKVLLSGAVLAACPNLKYIGLPATGYNNIDMDAARKRNIAVTNIPAYSTDAVAQHAFALILEISNRIGLHNASVAAGEWSASKYFCYCKTPILLLAGKSIGIVGYGSIGRRVGEIARAFGMEVHAYSREPEAALAADILSLHCPLTEENREFVNRDLISKMKDGAILINTARGGLINEPDLAEALKSGKLLAAGLDVLSTEPPSPDHPLIGLPNCFITPHNAWMPKEMRRIIIDTTISNLAVFLEGGRQNRVDLV